MNPQDELQMKVLALNAAQGNLENAKPILEWFSTPFIEAEVRRRVKAYIDSLKVDSAP